MVVRGVQDEKPAAEELDLSSMPVDDSYDGPMMEGTGFNKPHHVTREQFKHML
jgi:hypothetical protein